MAEKTKRGCRVTFGVRIRELRKARGLTLRQLAPLVSVGYTYLSRVETSKMTSGDYPSEQLIKQLATVLEADANELLLLAEKIPDSIRRRVLERPQAFTRFAALDDETMDQLLSQVADSEPGSVVYAK